MGSQRAHRILLRLCATTALMTSVCAFAQDYPIQNLAILQHPEVRVRIDEIAPPGNGGAAAKIEQDKKDTPAPVKQAAGATIQIQPQDIESELRALISSTDNFLKYTYKAAQDQLVNAAIQLPPELSQTALFTPSDQLANALAVHIADHGNGKGLRLNPRLAKDVRHKLASYYEEHAYKPVWIKNGDWTASALSIRDQLAKAASDALEPADYPMPTIINKNDPEALAQAELALSAAAILYARDARGGRLQPKLLSKHITPELSLPEAGEVLDTLANSKDAGLALENYNPQHAGYQALKKKLAEIRLTFPIHNSQAIPRGPTLTVGMKDDRVPLIRARLGLDISATEVETYDAQVAEAVANFQKNQGIKVSGNLNSQTIAALAQAENNPRQTEADIIANMERWRWLPADLGNDYIDVDIPRYEVRIVRDGKVVSTRRAIVGKAQSPTPVFSGNMQYVVVNPSWTIPPSIMKNEVLPGLARDPDYATKRGYQVTRTKSGQIIVRQPPGERNALGRIKFMFPNQHAVYLHDTPNRGLFSTKKRALSHGCVRVDQPFNFAEEVMGANWPAQKVQKLIGASERHISLSQSIPVHLNYFTLTVDENGELKRFDDIYGFNKLVERALGLKS
ncbi:L,D-transpeptidase family protein [Microvirga sp. W0021]|uniref:L,D-transpeptidase family protein n=1 Tax=Hohaiivirga grylli TaxID=3133970 RepID=A0ABV0BMY6_9HYPH